jgi:putative copper resistance protein D
MVLAAIVVFITAVSPFATTTVRWNLAISILGAMLLASLAGIGHTQVGEGTERLVHVLSDATHLLAAGAWLGGLVPLAYVLDRCRETPRGVAPIEWVLLRFSSMGYVAVATLIGTGFINSWFLVGSVSGLLRTSYGQTLLLKLALFVGCLFLPLRTVSGSFRP